MIDAEYMVFYDVLVDGDLRTTDCYCVGKNELLGELNRINYHGYQNVEVYQKIPTPPVEPQKEDV